MICNLLKEEKRRLAHQIDAIQNQLKDLPDGDFYCVKNGKYSKWFYNNGDGPTYLSKTKKEFAEKLLVSKYLSLKVKDLQSQITNIDKFLMETDISSNADKFILSNNEYSKLLQDYYSQTSSELIQWLNEPYERNTQYPEKLIHHTSFGLVVRSKAESIIATLLHINKIPFRYECALTLGYQTFYPDFTIRHPQTHEIYYWDHFGMMDDPGYVQKTYMKLQTYTSHNIIPNINLITSCETSNAPLDASYVEMMINHYFL